MNTLDKEEFRVKLEEINRLVEQKDYKGAMSVVDSIDWRRVKNVRTLCVVGEIYAANKRYADSKEIFLLAYHRSSIGKNILYRLIEVSLKMGDINEAMEYFEEYMEVAPNDNMKYILKYKIYKAKNASLEEQIRILEEYKEKEFTEKWSYELANLYYQAGDKKKCLDLCDEMVLWFSEGKYVMKALELKLRLGSLTGAEKEKYEQQFKPNLASPGDLQAIQENASREVKEETADPEAENTKAAPVSEEEGPVIESIRMDEKDINNAESLQEKISKGIRDIFNGGKKKEKEEEDFEQEEKEPENPEIPEIQEEMVRDISSKLDYVDVPDLEPEDEEQKAESQNEEKLLKPVEEEQPEAEQQDLSQTIKMPELKIPRSMKNMKLQDENVDAEEMPVVKPSVSADDFNFNLEDTILAAASAQGIEIPEEPAKAKKKTEAETKKAEVSEEVEEFTEEMPEEEFAEETSEEESEEFADEISEEEFEETADEAQEEDFEESAEEETEEFEEMMEEDPEEEIPAVPKRKNIPVLEEEDFLSEEDLREAEEEFLNGPSKKITKTPAKSERPEGMNTEMFNFQEEIKKVLGKNEDMFSEEFVDEDSQELKKAISSAAESEDYDELEDLEEEEIPEEEELTEEEELEQFIDSIQPENKRSPYDLVPRKPELTENEKKLFTYFVRVPGMKEQLIDTLCDVQMAAADKTSRTGNVIVMGGRETGKTRLISSLIPAICSELHLEASKVAYVFADQINGKDISRIVSKLAGGFLVIENANQLSPKTAEQLNKAMEFRTDGLTVIVEDEKIGMRKFIARYPKLAKKFTSMINIPAFTNDELVAFAKIYTKENGYTIDQMGMLALYKLISSNQKEDEPMNVGAVKNLIDAAIAKSQGGIRKFQRNISKKRTDHDGYIVLYEKDFS